MSHLTAGTVTSFDVDDFSNDTGTGMAFEIFKALRVSIEAGGEWVTFTTAQRTAILNGNSDLAEDVALGKGPRIAPQSMARPARRGWLLGMDGRMRSNGRSRAPAPPSKASRP